MSISGFCMLRISGQGLNKKEIYENTTLQPINFFQKGEVVHSKYGKHSHTHTVDSWIFEIEFESNQELDEVLNEFVSKLVKYKSYLQVMHKKHDVILWCDIYTDYAQFSFKLTPETINKIADLGIGIDFSFYASGD